MWTTDERDAWLGPALDDITAGQLEAFDDAARAIFARHADDEDDTESAEELTGALQVILGDDTLDALGAARQRALVAAGEAHSQLIGAVIASRELGLGPSEIARRAGLSRMTVTAALK